MQKILILENNSQLLFKLNDFLKSNGYLVSCAQNIDRVENLLKNNLFDLFLCEGYAEEDKDLDFLEKIKEKNLFMRVMVLSQKKSLQDRLKVLRLADDFLAKPFDLTELHLKIKNLLSLEKIKDSNFIENSHFLLKDSQALKEKNNFRPQELKILECLFKHKNLVVSYQTISNYVWGDKENKPIKKTISVYIRRIRSRLNIGDFKIETFKGRGYRLTIKREKYI